MTSETGVGDIKERKKKQITKRRIRRRCEGRRNCLEADDQRTACHSASALPADSAKFEPRNFKKQRVRNKKRGRHQTDNGAGPSAAADSLKGRKYTKREKIRRRIEIAKAILLRPSRRPSPIPRVSTFSAFVPSPHAVTASFGSLPTDDGRNLGARVRAGD